MARSGDVARARGRPDQCQDAGAGLQVFLAPVRAGAASELVGVNMSTTTLTASQRDLDDLLREPREALDLEVKEWLDLG